MAPSRKTGPGAAWRPASEAEATGTAAMLLLWGRATGALPPGLRDPDGLLAWWRADPDGCGALVARFAGLRADDGPQAALLRHTGAKLALRTHGTQDFSRDDLRAGLGVPPAVRRATWEDVTRLAASHLLVADIRPDDTLHWTGDPDALWPYGAWIAGAAVVRGGPPPPGARGFAAPPG